MQHTRRAQPSPRSHGQIARGTGPGRWGSVTARRRSSSFIFVEQNEVPEADARRVREQVTWSLEGQIR